MATEKAQPQNYDDVRDAWRRANLSPLWESTTAHKAAAGPEPSTLWPWKTVRPLLQAAMDMASPAAVERRVLSLVNPECPGTDITIGNIAIALQSLLPGESARAHRHSMNALRLVLEGRGAETIVDGKRCPMEYGDLILTPAWCWHEHHHRGDAPAIWLDALDVPLHMHLRTDAFQAGPANDVPVTTPDTAFATANMVPEHVAAKAGHSPVFRYGYADALRAVRAAPAGPDGIRRVRYGNPLTGGSAMTILDCGLMELEREKATSPSKVNYNLVCCVLGGCGKTTVGAEVISWEDRDVFSIPPNNLVRHQSSSERSQIFYVSDRDLFRRLELLEEDFGERTSGDG